MNKLELTPVELMQVLNWKKSKVYYWIKSGKFETVQKFGVDKVLISNEDIERLKSSKYVENSETVQNSSESLNNFEKIQENSELNITKNYENVSNFEAYELFNKSLETIERIHQTALTNFSYTTKLLTDGKTAAEEEVLRLQAEKKSIEEKLKQVEESQKVLESSKQQIEESFKKSQTNNLWKNITIVFLCIILLMVGLIAISQFRTLKQENINIEQTK